jgi:PAS domain S-box-containing protein
MSTAPPPGPEPWARFDALPGALLDLAPACIAVTDRAGQVVRWNRALADATGWPPEEARGRPIAELLFPEDERERARAADEEALAGGPARGLEGAIRARSGERRLMAWAIGALADERGAPAYLLRIGAVVTARRGPDDVARVERRFREVAEHLHEVFWIRPASASSFDYINPAYEAIWGRTRESLLAAPNSWLDAIDPDDRERVRLANALAGPAGTFHEVYRIVRPDGARRWIRARRFLLRDEAGTVDYTAGFAEDITDMKEAEAELSAHARQQAAVAALGCRALGGAEIAALFTEAAETVRRTLGVDFASVLELLPNGRSALRAGAGFAEGALGREVEEPGEPCAGLLADGGPGEAPRTALAALLREHGVASGIETAIGGARRLGTLGAYARTARAFSKVDRHFLEGMANVLAAAIERKRAEEALRESEKRLRGSQKMEAIGRLAGGVAHDLNNLLTVITGRAAILAPDAPPGTRLAGGIAEIRGAALRAASFVRQLVACGQKQVLEPRVLDLNAVVDGLRAALERSVGEDVALLVSLDPALGLVRADPGQVEQVITNLAANAREAMPAGGRLTLETANVALGPAEARARELPPGAYVALLVRDTGAGMDAETKSHLFEPFFTTKPPGEGCGLGLPTAYGIARQSGGTIEAESEPGRGAAFRVLLPRVWDERQPAGPPRAAAEAAARGAETVLLAEDEPSVRRLARDLLEEAGYAVLEAPQGRAALEVARAFAGPIHVLLTDVRMPIMGGAELARRLGGERPETRVIFMSGYADRAVEGELRGAPLIAKPFEPGALARKVRQVLDAPAGDEAARSA